MADDLQRSSDSLDEAIVVLQQARKSYNLNDRLQLIQTGLLQIQDAHDLIITWRTKGEISSRG